MTAEVEAFLEHAGVKGMKWGKRKAVETGPGKAPSVAKAVGLGMYGKKSSYTDPAALQKRVSAGKRRTRAIVAAGVGSAIAVAAARTSGPAQLGLRAVSMTLRGVGAYQGVRSTVDAVQGVQAERAARGL